MEVDTANAIQMEYPPSESVFAALIEGAAARRVGKGKLTPGSEQVTADFCASLAARNEEARMTIDTTKRGLRCRAKKTLRAHEATIEADTQGTVVHEVDNLDRRMILVKWDKDASLSVFPDEIEIVGDE